MKIVIASSEAIPFSKTGGLADVASGLAKAASGRSRCHPHPAALPAADRRRILSASRWERSASRSARSMRTRSLLRRQHAAEFGCRVVLVDKPDYFDRASLYTEKGHDYHDNCERFVFFSRAVLDAARFLEPQARRCSTRTTGRPGCVPRLVKTEWRGQAGCETDRGGLHDPQHGVRGSFLVGHAADTG